MDDAIDEFPQRSANCDNRGGTAEPGSTDPRVHDTPRSSAEVGSLQDGLGSLTKLDPGELTFVLEHHWAAGRPDTRRSHCRPNPFTKAAVLQAKV